MEINALAVMYKYAFKISIHQSKFSSELTLTSPLTDSVVIVFIMHMRVTNMTNIIANMFVYNPFLGGTFSSSKNLANQPSTSPTTTSRTR